MAYTQPVYSPFVEFRTCLSAISQLCTQDPFNNESYPPDGVLGSKDLIERSPVPNMPDDPHNPALSHAMSSSISSWKILNMMIASRI
jgi:hypothetical protein